MKFFILISSLFIYFSATAQTPYLSVKLKMDSAKAGSIRYKIEMKICEPKNATDRGDWFTPDTSKIDFASLKLTDISCGEYFETEKGYKEEDPVYNQFKHGSHNFAWEKILVFRISNASSRGWLPEMYIVVPVRYKAFVTYIDLSDIEFQSGKLMFVTDTEASYKRSSLSVTKSLKDHGSVEVKNSPLKDLLEK